MSVGIEEMPSLDPRGVGAGRTGRPPRSEREAQGGEGRDSAVVGKRPEGEDGAVLSWGGGRADRADPTWGGGGARRR